MPNNTLSRAELSCNGNVKNIHYGDILIKYGAIVNVEYDEIPFIIVGKESKGYPYLHDGDVIIADTAEDETVGKCSEIVNTNGTKIESGLHTIPCHPQLSFVPMYLGYYMNSPHYHRQLIPLMQGVKVLSVSKGNIAKTVISAPCSPCEQEKIVAILHLLDCRMNKQQQLIDILKKYKRGLLSIIFPQKGKTIPQYRFSGFAHDWKERKWSDTVDISTEMVDPKTGKYDELPHVAPGNIESFTGQLYDNVKLVKDESLISGKFHFYEGDIIYGKINPQLGKYVYTRFEGLTSADAYVLNAKEGIVQKFLYSILQTKDFFDYSVSVSKRSGMPKINRDELNSYNFLAPSEEEQIQIADLLLNIDHLIALGKHKYELYIKLKKGMLQQLFI